jgi:hypothetical protein
MTSPKQHAIPAASATPCAYTSFRQILGSHSSMSLGAPGGQYGVGEALLRISPVLSLFAASLIALTPVHALAQTTDTAPESVRDRSHPELEPQGTRLGGFTLNATLDLSVTDTDNVFAAASGATEDDNVYTVNPMARLSSNWSRHELVFEGNYLSRTYENFDSEDADEHSLRAAGRLDVGDSTNIRASVRTAHQVTPRTDPDSPFIGVPVEYDRDELAAGIEHRFARVRVSADARHNEYDYDVVNSRDHEETVFSGRAEVELTPRIGFLLRGTVDERDYDNTPALNSEGTPVLAGVTVNTDLMRGELAVGQFERDYDGAGVGSFDGLAIAGELEWYITQLTTITLNARRDADDQVGVTTSFPYETMEYGARIDHELQRNVILTAGVRSGEREYDTLDRDDEYTEIEAGADYILNRRASLRLRYQNDEVESSGADAYRDYEVEQWPLGLSLRL